MRRKIVSALRKYWWLATLVAGVLAFGLYMYQIGESSIWFDEAFSVALINKSPSELIHLTAVDVHPPLYYLLLQGWTEIFGLSETALRSFSAVCMAGAVVMGLLLVRRYFGAKAFYVTLPFLVLAPFLLRYAQEARMYALVALISMAATYVLLRAEESKRTIWWVLYALLIAAGLYTHYYCGLIWIAHWAWHWYATRHTPGARFFDKRWLLSYAGAALLFLPWLPTFLDQADAVQGGFWIGPVSQDTLVNVASNVLMYMQEWEVREWLSLVLVLAVGALIALVVRAWHSVSNQLQKNHFALLLCMGFVPVVVLFLVSLPPMQPLFVERYLVPAALAMYLLIGVSLALAFRTKRWLAAKVLVGVGVIVLFICGMVRVYDVGNFNYNQNQRPYAKELIAELNKQLGSDDAVVALSPYSFYEYSYYDQQNNVYFVDPEKTLGSVGASEPLMGSPRLIQDLSVFGETHDQIWLTGGDLEKFTVPDSWVEIGTVQIGNYKAVGYRTQ